MRLSEFDYDLPPELIAQEPLAQRDASRMLVVDRKKQTWSDANFSSLPDLLTQKDLIAINNTRVFPARLLGQREHSGGRVEVLLVHELEPSVWSAMVRPGQRVKKGSKVLFGGGRLSAELMDDPGEELRRIRFVSSEPLNALIDELGETPLPPYIKRDHASSTDRLRYQTIFAQERGAIAAPTAGLHFTPEILKRIGDAGATIEKVTLHVGYGTFAPVRVEDVEDHSVAPEYFELTQEAADSINRARLNAGRIIAVGTTTTRVLESAIGQGEGVVAQQGYANLTIRPGYRFRVIDCLLTNFHLPRSSLLILVSAFAGRELILRAYRHAVEQRYRFYSYGDCMLIV
jgi:S-adenosylmethionine:tRNA ribosyltransferase-isomerase